MYLNYKEIFFTWAKVKLDYFICNNIINTILDTNKKP